MAISSFSTVDLNSGATLAVTRGAEPSVVQLRADDLSPEKSAAVVVAALTAASEELERGVVLTIDAKRARLELLPLYEV